jgi:hypothetical protein
MSLGANFGIANDASAAASSKAVVNNVGNYGFIARVIDNGEPGFNDQFGLRVTNPSAVLVVDLTFNPITLAGGNFSVPKLTGK